jgi:hypothetical protein
MICVPALDPSPVIPSDLSFGYLSAQLKSPVKIPIPRSSNGVLHFRPLPAGDRIMRNTGLIPVLLLLGTVALADMPYTFAKGERARASHVNENFEALDDRISELEGDVWAWPHRYSYNYIDVPIGTELTLKGRQFVMVSMPLIDIESGNRYRIKIPAELRSCSCPDGGDEYPYINLNVTHTANSGQYTDSFSGLPSRVGSYYDNRSFGLRLTGGSSGGNFLTTSTSVYGGIQVLLGSSTSLNLSPPSFAAASLEETINSSDRDFTDDIDWNALIHPDDDLADHRDWLNHIKIERIL